MNTTAAFCELKLPDGKEGKFYMRLTQRGRFVQIYIDLWRINYDLSREAAGELSVIYGDYLDSLPKVRKEIWYSVGKTVVSIEVLHEDMNRFIALIKNKLENNLVSICENS